MVMHERAVLNRFSHVQLFVAPWTVACQAPLSMGFSRQEYWSVLPFPPPGDLPGPGIKLVSSALAGRFLSTEPPRKPPPAMGKQTSKSMVAMQCDRG